MVKDLTPIVDTLLSVDVKNIINKAILLHEQQITDLNRRQLYAGNDSNGKALSPPYHPWTEMYKQAEGKPADRVTLNDTGDFYESIYLEPFGNAFEFESTDWKRDKLIYKYGEGILGITEEDKPDASEIIKDTVKDLFNAEFRQ